MEVQLVVLEGKHKDRVIPLPPTLFVIGRGPRCHLRPHDQLVSKLHCAIACWAGRVIVRDLKSVNGTFINDQKINGQVMVRDGDELRVGRLAFAFHIKDPNPAEPVAGLDEHEVRWLLESPSDSAVLAAGANQTWVLQTPLVPAERESKPGDSGSGAVSAGEYMRDYFKKHKHPPSQPADGG